MDADRPDELTPQRRRSHLPADRHPPTSTSGRRPHNKYQLTRQIDELDRLMRHEDPALWKRFRKLDRAPRTTVEVAVFTLLAASASLLAAALAMSSVVAWLAGVAVYLAAGLIAYRHQRLLRRAPPTGPAGTFRQ